MTRCCTVVPLIPSHIKFCAGRLSRHKSHTCMSNDCINSLGVSVHDNGAADFTWVDLETLLVDKKLKLVCLLEHIVLRLSRRIKRAGSGLYCSVQDGRGGEAAGERFLRPGWRSTLPFCAPCILSTVSLDERTVPSKQTHP